MHSAQLSRAPIAYYETQIGYWSVGDSLLHSVSYGGWVLWNFPYLRLTLSTSCFATFLVIILS